MASRSRFPAWMIVLLGLWGASACAGDSVLTDQPYREPGSGDAYARERCLLDILPATGDGAKAPVVVWFHGGGLTSGEKSIPAELRGRGFVVLAPNYRLSPRARVVDSLDDATAAVAWTFRHAAEYGGDPARIHLSGHSAGGWLVAMIALRKDLLAAHGIDADQIASVVPLSPQVITHFTARAERGMRDTQPLIDELAPLYHVRAVPFPILLVTGDREREMLGRYEENAYFARMLRLVGNTRVTLHEVQGFDHGSMAAPGLLLLREHVKRAAAPVAKP
jgi:acetyl esterase/lipase